MCSHILEKVKLIYDRLEDEESKGIFINRLLFSITSDWKYVENIVAKYLKGYNSDKIFCGIEKVITNLQLKKNEKYIIYGAGMYGHIAYETLSKIGIEPIAFCDTDCNKWEKEYCGLKIISPQDLKEYSDAYILLAVWNYSKSLKDYLVEKNIDENKIIDCFEVENYVDVNQYFDENIIKWGQKEIFVDCGCFDFETSKIFTEKCPDYKKIICFEPNEENREVIKQKIDEYSKKNVEIIPFGVWDKKEELRFGGSGSSSKICLDGDTTIDVIPLDDIISDEVTFIKMDIEGAELKALKGAENIIIRNKPRLAISVYHKPEDILEIPEYILEIMPEYKLYLRHYSNFYATETVLYAI